MRVGIAGLGNIGQRHLEMLSALPQVEVVAAAEPRVGGEQSVTGLEVPVYPEFEEMLERSSLDAVVIASPSGMHAEQGIRAAAAGVHVITEKPIATTMGGAESRVEDCPYHRGRLAGVPQYRFFAPRMIR